MIFKRKSKKESIKENKPLDELEIITQRHYDEELDAFILKDGKYMDIVEIVSRDLSSKNEEDVYYEIYKKMKFYKTYSDDVKIISLNFPISTLVQRKNLEVYRQKTLDNIRKKWIDIMIDELKNIENTITKREYYLMYFGQNKDIFLKNKTYVLSFMSGKSKIFDELDILKKLKIIKKLYNQNSLILANEVNEDSDIWEIEEDDI